MEKAFPNVKTTDEKWLEDYRTTKKGTPIFDFYSQADLEKLGKEGWELVSAVPVIATIPDAEYITGTDYDSDRSAKEHFKPHYSNFSNIRTERILLLFKRPY